MASGRHDVFSAGGEALKCRRVWNAVRKHLPDLLGAFLRVLRCGVDFQIIDAGPVHMFLPGDDRRRDRLAGFNGNIAALPFRSFREPALHYDIERAAYADEQSGQSCQLPRAIAEDAERARIGVMMSELGDDIETKTAMSGDRSVECGIKARNQRLEIGSLPAGAQADARPIALRRDVSHIGVDTEIDPYAVESRLDDFDDA